MTGGRLPARAGAGLARNWRPGRIPRPREGAGEKHDAAGHGAPAASSVVPGWKKSRDRRLLAGHDLADRADHLGDGRVVQLAFPEGEVGLDVPLVVEDDGDVRLLGDLVGRVAGGVVDGEDDSFEALFLREGFELIGELLVVV